MTKVAICIATFRRTSGLAALLDGLAGQQSSRSSKPDLLVIVADNDPLSSAAPLCQERAPTLPFPIIYTAEPRQGIPYARNKALENVPDDTDFIAMLDDDEVPRLNWLDTLLAEQQTHGADCLYGPVEPILPPEAPDWVKQGRFMERQHHQNGEQLTYASSNNVFISWPFLKRTGLRFDPYFRFTGGSDGMLFMQAQQLGLVIRWSAGAVVDEMVPPSRLSARWLLARQYRIGNTLALCERRLRLGFPTYIIRFIKGCGRLVRGTARLVLALPFGQAPRLQAASDMARGTGMLTGLLGLRYEEYHPERVEADRSLGQRPLIGGQ